MNFSPTRAAVGSCLGMHADFFDGHHATTENGCHDCIGSDLEAGADDGAGVWRALRSAAGKKTVTLLCF